MSLHESLIPYNNTQESQQTPWHRGKRWKKKSFTKNLWRVDGLKEQPKQPTKMSIFPNLSFREVCRCQGTLHPLLIRREHLVNAEKNTAEQWVGNMVIHCTKETSVCRPTPSHGCTVTYFFTGILPSLLVWREMRTYLGLKHKGLYSVTHGGSKGCCVRAQQQYRLSCQMTWRSLTFSPGRPAYTRCFLQHCRQLKGCHLPSSVGTKRDTT